MDNTTSPNTANTSGLGFRLELRGDVWVVQYDTQGCHPATSDEIKLWLALEAAEAELTRLSELDGATEPGEPHAWPSTPGEFAARWNARTLDERAERVQAIEDDGSRSMACRIENHHDEIAGLRAELTRRDTVIADGDEAQETSEVKAIARLMIVNAGWDPDDPEDDTEEDLEHIYVEAAGFVEAARMARAAAPVSLEAVKAETAAEDLREWADYFGHIGSQVGDPPFTQELVVRALRGPRPFGASASTEGNNRG